MKNLRENIRRARGQAKADLVLKNARIVNTFTGEILEGNIGIYGEVILGIGDYVGEREIDLKGKFVCPGLIDSHVHIESSMVSPVEFGKTLIGHGVTSIIADPHEIANVHGKDGIVYILEEGKKSPIDVFVNLPSCVPATEFETSGAELLSQDLLDLKDLDQVLGLGEVMNFPGVLSGDKELLLKLHGFGDRPIDGHGPGLKGKDLNAYIISGIKTDHEASSLDEVMEKIRKGMYILVREGSAAKDLKNIVGAVNKDNLSMFLMCTDDRHPRDLIREGSIDNNIRLAVESGLDVVDAIRMGTINAARAYGLKNRGAIGPGYIADLVILDDLNTFKISSVIKSGQLVLEEGVFLAEISDSGEIGLENSLNIGEIGPEDLEISLKSNRVNVIGVIPGSLVTERLVAQVDVENGYYQDTQGLNRLYVIERHRNTGNIGKGLIKNYNLRDGAIATTIGHDSHNLMVLGDNLEDILLVIREIEKNRGGLALASRGKIIGSLGLEIGGLMSSKTIDQVARDFDNLVEKAHKELNISRDIDPFMTLSFMALAVIPSIKLTDRGLFDLDEFKFIGLEEL